MTQEKSRPFWSTTNRFPGFNLQNLFQILSLITQSWHFMLATEFSLCSQPFIENSFWKNANNGRPQCDVLMALGFVVTVQVLQSLIQFLSELLQIIRRLFQIRSAIRARRWNYC